MVSTGHHPPQRRQLSRWLSGGVNDRISWNDFSETCVLLDEGPQEDFAGALLLDESEAIRRCQEGQRDPFRFLVERYGKVLYGTAYRMTRDRGLAEDLVQEAFLRVWRGMPSFRGGGNFKAWIVRILVNHVMSERRKKRVREVPLVEAIASSQNPEAGEKLVLNYVDTFELVLKDNTYEGKTTVQVAFINDPRKSKFGDGELSVLSKGLEGDFLAAKKNRASLPPLASPDDVDI